MKKIPAVLIIVMSISSVALAAKWSDFTAVKSAGGIELSYRLRAINEGWFVEWKGENRGSEWGNPISSSRVYTCSNGKRQEVRTVGNFGPLPPGESRKGGARDSEICVKSSVEQAEISIEIREVHENVRKRYE